MSQISALVLTENEELLWSGADRKAFFYVFRAPSPWWPHMAIGPPVPSRLLAMAKPAYYAVVNHAVDRPAIIFVPSAKQAKLTAVDLLTFATADDDPKRFLHAEADDIAPFLSKIKDDALAHTIAYVP